MQRSRFFFREFLTPEILDEMSDAIFGIIQAHLNDFCEPGVLARILPGPLSPAILGVGVNPFTAYAKTGLRISVDQSGTVMLNRSGDVPIGEFGTPYGDGEPLPTLEEGQEIWISLGIVHAWLGVDPATDGYAQEVSTREVSSFKFRVVYGTPAAINSAFRPEKTPFAAGCLLCDVRIQHGETTVTAGNIDYSRADHFRWRAANLLGDTTSPVFDEPRGAGTVLAAPPDADGNPTFRALEASDLPDLGLAALAYLATCPIANGGTGAATAADARNALDVPQRVAGTTDNAVPRFDGTTGAMQNSGVTIDDADQLSGAACIITEDGDEQFPVYTSIGYTPSGFFFDPPDVCVTVDEHEVARFATNGFKLSAGATINEFSVDGTMIGNSDSAVPTEKAAKTYVDTTIDGYVTRSGGSTVTLKAYSSPVLNCTTSAIYPQSSYQTLGTSAVPFRILYLGSLSSTSTAGKRHLVLDGNEVKQMGSAGITASIVVHDAALDESMVATFVNGILTGYNSWP